MENIEKFERLLRDYPFQSLSPEEKLWVNNFVASEAEYESLRRISLQLDGLYSADNPITADPMVLKNLKRHWAARHPVSPSLVSVKWSMPAYAAMIALVMTSLLGWWAGSSRSPEIVYVDRPVARIDTLRIVAKPDTVVVERVVYRTVGVLPSAMMTKTKAVDAPLVNRGINMKEKEELEKLLVSGSF